MTHRDKTARFKELRRLYQPHSIKIKDISNNLHILEKNIKKENKSTLDALQILLLHAKET